MPVWACYRIRASTVKPDDRARGYDWVQNCLHLDGGKLQRRMVATANSVARKVRPPAFVELTSPATSGLPEYSKQQNLHFPRQNLHLL